MSYSVYPPAASGITQSELITEPSWTLIGSSSGGVSTIDFTGISGYRKLRVVGTGIRSNNTSSYTAGIRINGDSSNNYVMESRYIAVGTGGSWATYEQYDAVDRLRMYNLLAPSTIPTSSRSNFFMEIDNANNSERIKRVTYNWVAMINSSSGALYQATGFYKGSPATITSLSLVADNTINSMTSPEGVYLYGAN